jgi:hypothetical protein
MSVAVTSIKKPTIATAENLFPSSRNYNNKIRPRGEKSKGDAVTSKTNRNACPFPAVTRRLKLQEAEHVKGIRQRKEGAILKPAVQSA